MAEPTRPDPKPVTSEVAGSSPVVPAIPLQRFTNLSKHLAVWHGQAPATGRDTKRHHAPPIRRLNCSSYCSSSSAYLCRAQSQEHPHSLPTLGALRLTL